jgi:hypothetical protein
MAQAQAQALGMGMGDYLFCPNIHPKQKGRLVQDLVMALVLGMALVLA